MTDRPASATGAGPAVSAEAVEMTFAQGGGHLTLRLEGLELSAGGIALLVGESGSGKSTILAMLGAALRPTRAARLELCGRTARLSTLEAWRQRDEGALQRFRARELGFVLQTGGLLPWLSLRRNIAETAMLSSLAGGAPPPGRGEEIAVRLGVGHVLDRRPRDVSVGQRQRAAVARAMAHGPSLLLADEPTAALDGANADAVDRLMIEMARDYGMAAVIATHRPDRPHWRDLPRLTQRLSSGPEGVVSVFAA